MGKQLSAADEQHLSRVMSIRNRKKKIHQRPDTGPAIDLMFTEALSEMVSEEGCLSRTRC